MVGVDVPLPLLSDLADLEIGLDGKVRFIKWPHLLADYEELAALVHSSEPPLFWCSRADVLKGAVSCMGLDVSPRVAPQQNIDGRLTLQLLTHMVLWIRSHAGAPSTVRFLTFVLVSTCMSWFLHLLRRSAP
jgi:hypothetical protein